MRWHLLRGSCCGLPFVLLLQLLNLLCSHHAEAFQARISQPVVQHALAPGQAVSGTIELDNQSEEPVQLAVYLQDWEYLEGGSGEKLFSAAGTSQWSASDWISYYPNRLELPGHGKGIVEYTVRVPNDSSAVGGRYAVLFFESALGLAPKNERGVTVQYTGRLGSLFEIEVAGQVKRTGTVTGPALGRPDEHRPLSLSFSFTNTGNVVIRPKAYFNIVDEAGRYFGRGEFNQLYTSPGRSGSAKAEWSGSLPPGRYTVVLTVEVGASDVLVMEQPLQVKRELTIERVTFSARAPVKGQVTVRNTGNFQADAEGTLILSTQDGEAVGQWPIEGVSLAPDEQRAALIRGATTVSAGTYQCRVQLTSDAVTVERTLACVVP